MKGEIDNIEKSRFIESGGYIEMDDRIKLYNDGREIGNEVLIKSKKIKTDTIRIWMRIEERVNNLVGLFDSISNFKFGGHKFLYNKENKNNYAEES